jgi:hypothetical protein
MARKHPPNETVQPLLPLFIPTIQIPQGDGSILVKPGKPVAWLNPKQFGEQVGLSPDAIRRKIGSEALPERFIEYAGPKLIRIRADALEHFREHYRNLRGLGA